MKLTVSNFDIKQIAESGQCFRINETGDGSFRIIAFGKLLRIRQCGNEIELSCSEEEWESIWSSYFDMDTDYDEIRELIMSSADEYLINAYNYGSGIRILRQDLWESIVSFIISQNNNIPRIKSSIEKICKLVEGEYSFPRPGDIDPEAFMDKGLGLGYRSEYLRDIYEFVSNNPQWLEMFKNLTYEDAMKELTSIRGIGNKVANCICLFGLHHVEAFPIDTHIKQIIEKNYPNGFDTKKFPHVAGIIQQYMFYYDL